MNKSNSIGELASALSKLQGKIHDVFKSKSGYGYKYSDLASVLEITRPLCAEHELSVSQLCTTDERADIVGVETILMHSSGEYLSSTMFMPITLMKGMSLAQSAGSVITYARRYALAAILGITQTDTDAAVDASGVAELAKANPVTYTPNPVSASPMITLPLTPEYLELQSLMAQVKVAPTEVARWLAKAKCKDLTQLSNEQLKGAIELLKKRIEDKSKDAKDAV